MEKTVTLKEEFFDLYETYINQGSNLLISSKGYHENEHDNSGGHPDFHNDSHDNTPSPPKLNFKVKVKCRKLTH